MHMEVDETRSEVSAGLIDSLRSGLHLHASEQANLDDAIALYDHRV